MMNRIGPWFLRLPDERIRRLSLGCVVAASAVMLLLTAQVLLAVVGEQIVKVPRIDVWAAEPATVGITLGAWLVGTVALVTSRWRARLGWLLPVGAAGAFTLDRQTLGSAIGYLLVVAATAHWWSAWLADRQSHNHLRAAPLRILQVQISVVFFWTSFAKLNERFMSGAVLMEAFIGPVSAPEFLLDRRSLVALAVVTVVAEAFFAVGLWLDKVRPVALAGVLVFHLAILAFFRPSLALAAFALAMASGYSLFLRGSWSPPERPGQTLEHDGSEVA